jgi:hypothetical protein
VDVADKTICEQILKAKFDIVGVINVARDIDWWRSLVSTLVDIQVPLKAENFVTGRGTTYHLEKDSAPWS